MTRTIEPLLTVLLVVALAASAAVAPVAADHNEDDAGVSDALTDDGGTIDMIRGAVAGIIERVQYGVSNLRNDSDVTESRDDAVSKFNEHSASYVEYLNARNVHDGEVIEITFREDGETATAYIVADYNTTSDEYESATAVETTDREVDHEVELRGMASDNAADELERFYDEYASTGDDIDARYTSEMASKYLNKIDEPFTGR